MDISDTGMLLAQLAQEWPLGTSVRHLTTGCPGTVALDEPGCAPDRSVSRATAWCLVGGGVVAVRFSRPDDGAQWLAWMRPHYLVRPQDRQRTRSRHAAPKRGR